MSENMTVQMIYKSRNNLLDMLKEQNYDVSQYENVGINEVNSLLSSKQLDMLLKKTNSEKKIYIKYHLAKALRTTNIQELIEELFSLDEILKKTDDLMIIVKDEPNETLVKSISSIWETENIFITVLTVKQLQFNILNHVLVPKHRILNEIESEEIRKKYNIMDDSQMPDISRHGPVSKILGLRPGEICEITRSSKTGIISKFYRICSS